MNGQSNQNALRSRAHTTHSGIVCTAVVANSLPFVNAMTKSSRTARARRIANRVHGGGRTVNKARDARALGANDNLHDTTRESSNLPTVSAIQSLSSSSPQSPELHGKRDTRRDGATFQNISREVHEYQSMIASIIIRYSIP